MTKRKTCECDCFECRVKRHDICRHVIKCIKRPWANDRCAHLAKGFCAASIDGYCISGYIGPNGEHRDNPICHG